MIQGQRHVRPRTAKRAALEVKSPRVVLLEGDKENERTKQESKRVISEDTEKKRF